MNRIIKEQQKGGIFELQRKSNKVQDENSAKKLKFKPIILTKKYISNQTAYSKKTIKDKIKLKWTNYVVGTFNNNDDDS